jgi:hypothetical protein
MMNELDSNFEDYEAAEIRRGADFSSLTADDVDSIVRDDNGDAFGMSQGIPIPLSTKIYQTVEDGISYDIERRQDGSEWLLGKTGEKKRGVAVSFGNVEGEKPGIDPGEEEGGVFRDIRRGLSQGAFDAGKSLNEALPILGKPVDLVNEGVGYVGDVFGLDLRSDYPVGGSEMIRDGVEAIVDFADFIMPDALQKADIEFRSEKASVPLLQEIVTGITEFGVQAVTPAMYLRAFSAAGPFARGIAWGGVADFINAQPDDATAIASLTEFLTSAQPEERSAVANAVIDVFAAQKEDPEFINRARVALDGMVIGGAVEKGVEYIVRASKMIPWDRLQESIVQAGGRADERLASMAAGTTLSANPVGAVGDLALSAAGRVIGKQNVEEYPNSLTTMLYNVAEAPAKPKGARKWTKALLGRQMQEAAEKSGQSILKYDDAALDTLSTRMADEAIAALKKEGNASDWYNSKITEMNNVLQKLHPELESGTTEEGIFKAGLALTSNGATVDYNLKAAEHVYTVFKASGKFPEDLKSLEAAIGGFGQEGPTLVKQFARANDMIAEMGADKFVEFLNTKFTVKELTQLGFKLSGEAVDFETYGSAIFGPKIGGGFYQNLRGNFNPVTFDRWWMASWGRWTGQPLLKTTGKARTDQLNRFRAASGKKYKDPQKAIAAAKKIYATYRKNNFQPRTELNQSAQRLAEGATDKMREQPAGPSERTFMRNVTYATVEKLKSMGYNLTPADLQATVWYPEKELHGFYGIGSGRSAPDDYAAAATRLLGERNAKR